MVKRVIPVNQVDLEFPEMDLKENRVYQEMMVLRVIEASQDNQVSQVHQAHQDVKERREVLDYQDKMVLLDHVVWMDSQVPRENQERVLIP